MREVNSKKGRNILILAKGERKMIQTTVVDEVDEDRVTRKEEEKDMMILGFNF